MGARELDQFYTKSSVAKKCFDIVDQNFVLNDFDVVFEPCCGTGSFYSLFPEDKKLGIDLDPKIAGVTKLDFFDFVPDPNLRYIAITNPPFGKNSSLALKFFQKLAGFCDVIAMVVPRTFRKKRFQNRLDPHFHLEYEEVLDSKSFIFEGRSYSVPTVFQIWVKKPNPRQKFTIKTTSEDFEFTTPDKADFAIQRIGVRAGLIRQDFLGYSPNSHLFIKSKVQNVLETFMKIDFNDVKHNTAGNPSVSPGEIVELYNAVKCNQHIPKLGI